MKYVRDVLWYMFLDVAWVFLWLLVSIPGTVWARVTFDDSKWYIKLLVLIPLLLHGLVIIFPFAAKSLNRKVDHYGESYLGMKERNPLL